MHFFKVTILGLLFFSTAAALLNEAVHQHSPFLSSHKMLRKPREVDSAGPKATRTSNGVPGDSDGDEERSGKEPRYMIGIQTGEGQEHTFSQGLQLSQCRDILWHWSWRMWHQEPRHRFDCCCVAIALRHLSVGAFVFFLHFAIFFLSGYNGGNPNENPLCGKRVTAICK